ncbi:MAG: HAD hydrolase family protein [Bacteroidota bacterium]
MATHPSIFITDLDGTLLRNDSSLSAFSKHGIEAMIEEGTLFTIATARSVTSSKGVLGDLNLSLPIICSNGAYISDLKSSEHRYINSHPKPADEAVLELVLEKGFHPFLGTFDGKQDHLYLGEVANEGIAWYKADREKAKDRRLTTGVDVRIGLQEHVISLNVIDRKGPLEELAAQIEELFPHTFCLYVYENWYDESWFWLSIYHKNATKGAAITTLLDDLSLPEAYVTVFGDNLNDLSMFKMAHKGVAMGNARQEVIEVASEIIATNEEDSVVKYIAKVTNNTKLL